MATGDFLVLCSLILLIFFESSNVYTAIWEQEHSKFFLLYFKLFQNLPGLEASSYHTACWFSSPQWGWSNSVSTTSLLVLLSNITVKAVEKGPSISVLMLFMVNLSFLCVQHMSGERLLWLRHRHGVPSFCCCVGLAASSRVAALSCSQHSPRVPAVTRAAHSTKSQTEWIQGKLQSLVLLCLYQSFTAGWDASSSGPINREVAFLHNFPEDWTHLSNWKEKGGDSPLDLLNSFQDSPSHEELRLSGIYSWDKLIC